MQPIWIGTIAAFGTVILGLATRVIAARARRARGVALAEAASRLGFSFTDNAWHDLDTHWSMLRPFSSPRGRVWATHLLSRAGLALFHYRIQPGRQGTRLHRPVRPSSAQYALRQGKVPDFCLVPLPPHSFLPPSPGPTPEGMLRLELQPPLASRYALFAVEASERLVQVLSEIIGDERDWFVDGDAGWIIAGHPRALSIESLGADIERFSRVVDGLAHAFEARSYREAPRA
jgi:hypothetical protein